ncbi:hypothetical protein ISCGN_003430 [Ixodes scapularis]
MPVQWPVQLADGGLIRPSSTSSGSRRSRFDDLRSFVIGLCTFQATQDSTRRRPETRGHEYADQGPHCSTLQTIWSQLPEHPIWTDGPDVAPRQERARRPAGHMDSDSSDDASRERVCPVPETTNSGSALSEPPL